jgi:YihY family inner membrane protein
VARDARGGFVPRPSGYITATMPTNTPDLRTIPETVDLTGDDAAETLRTVGWWRLATGAFHRFTRADGTTHARALGHAGVLTLLSTIISVVGLAGTLHMTTLTNVLRGTLQQLAPGGSGGVLQEALSQGSRTSGSLALAGGIVAALWSGTIFMALLERAADRIYGLSIDRSFRARYAIGFLLNLTAGTLLTLAVLLLAAGPAVGRALASVGSSVHAVATVWSWARWPAGVVLAAVGITLVYKIAPARRQPGLSWMAAGGALATLLWVAFSFLLALYLNLDSGVARTYGPVLGVIGAILWSYLTGLALLLGLAFCAELESVRAGPDVGGPLSG